MDSDPDKEDAIFLGRTRKTVLQLQDDDWRLHRAPSVNKYALRHMTDEELTSYLDGCGGYDLEQTCRMLSIPVTIGKGRDRKKLKIEEMRDVLREKLMKNEVM